MKTAKQKPTKRRPRNPFDCAGWRRFVMRAVERDQMAARAAQARRTATGETLH
jgi:hypothetical protein